MLLISDLILYDKSWYQGALRAYVRSAGLRCWVFPEVICTRNWKVLEDEVWTGCCILHGILPGTSLMTELVASCVRAETFDIASEEEARRCSLVMVP